MPYLPCCNDSASSASCSFAPSNRCGATREPQRRGSCAARHARDCGASLDDSVGAMRARSRCCRAGSPGARGSSSVGRIGERRFDAGRATVSSQRAATVVERCRARPARSSSCDAAAGDRPSTASDQRRLRRRAPCGSGASAQQRRRRGRDARDCRAGPTARSLRAGRSRSRSDIQRSSVIASLTSAAMRTASSTSTATRRDTPGSFMVTPMQLRGQLHRGLVVRDEDELHALGHFLDGVAEAADVVLVERRVDLVQQAERRRDSVRRSRTPAPPRSAPSRRPTAG